ncbi:SLC13 family permease [Leminorella grimontii]|uniref:SLC13 family permease n=1 Tax=Leminorella grimontii TaxID=82981 RepID=A0AAV5N2J1_9GAMM|nr:SLC13 family permease [Leminorella grimontii]KFC96782.1 putative transport protein [Leminorella grimontii ATCC 33999 = DSM 5078]GKX55929.1 SLC13 family permease [Leminorella grimontii]GKX58974.1 SLC13 family permease [Leminorella grimontii]VFS57491.1 Na(+)/dicarboxylate symporter [Leminorella grimontii]
MTERLFATVETLAGSQLFWVVFFLLVAIGLFISNKVRMDVVALLLIVVFVISDILTVPEAVSGFSDPNVILIALLFVIGEGLVRTGIAYQVGDWLVRVAGNSEAKLLILLMLAVASLGSVMSSTGVVAIFIPVVMSVSSRLNRAPGRLMMPLAFAGLISGMMTLVATPPNLVVNSEMVRYGVGQFDFFSFTPIGVVILLLGIGYMLLVRRFLVKPSLDKPKGSARRAMRDLIREYKLSGRARRFSIRPGSPLIGRTLDELHLRSRYSANVVGIERWRKFRRVMISAFASTELRVHDILLVDMHDPDVDVRHFCTEEQLEPMILRGEYFSEQAREVGMAEVSLIPESEYIGKTLRQMAFRTRYSLNVIGIRRGDKLIDSNQQIDIELKMGDMMLVIGDWRQIRMLQSNTRDFLVMNLPAEVDEVAPSISQAPHAVLCLFLMIFLMVTDLVPNVIAALLACLLMGKFRCIDMESAYKSIHWPTLVLIVGMLPFAHALQKTGGIDLVVQGLMEAVGDRGPHVVLASLFILSAVIGLFISNTATAVLMAPIAIGAANQMGVSALPFAMVVAVAASAAFMTPVSSPVNTMVLGPGGYKFSDFMRIGIPFTLLVMVVSVVIIPILFPF